MGLSLANGNITATLGTITAPTINATSSLRRNRSDLNNTAVAWSSGLSSDAYHYINSGSNALVIRDSSGNVSANFIGNASGSSTSGQVYFYKDVFLLGNLNFGIPGSGGQAIDTKISTALAPYAMLSGSAFLGNISAPTINATPLQQRGSNINTLFAPKTGSTNYAPQANPTFTGTLTAPTINASSTLKVNSVDISTIYAPLSSPTFYGAVSVDSIQARSNQGLPSGLVSINENMALAAGKMLSVDSLQTSVSNTLFFPTAIQVGNTIQAQTFKVYGTSTFSDQLSLASGKAVSADSLTCIANAGSSGAITVSDNMTLSFGKTLTTPNLSVSGTVSGSGFFNNLYHSAGVVSGPSGNILYTNGTTFTVSHTASSGVYTITFSTNHPKTIYPILVVPQTNNAAYISVGNITSSGFTVHTWNGGGAATDAQFSFTVNI